LGSVFALSITAIGGLWLTQQSLKPIEQSFQQLKQFTADASHELRSPLTAIKTSVEVMRSHPERIHPADVKKLGAIASATNQMTHLVEDLLLLARTDAASAAPAQDWRAIPLDEVLEDLVELLEPKAVAKAIELQSNLQPNVSVMGDAAQLSRLFSNLLENAIAYTPARGTIALSMHRSDRFVIVSVEDTGIGIAPEQLPLIFHRFWRADKARVQREGGLGLGLAIAQAIAQRHRGEITVTSQFGVGSCFKVRLPTDS
jgi:signal transduction histidine kinase